VPQTRPPYPDRLRRKAIELARISSKSQRQIAENLGTSDDSSVTGSNAGIPAWIDYLEFSAMRT
jgi:hypothetical protein